MVWFKEVRSMALSMIEAGPDPSKGFGQIKVRSESKDLSMPLKSEAQRRYFEANKEKLEEGVNVKEWEESSKGLKLPERSAQTEQKSH
jgi:hypothetical protein